MSVWIVEAEYKWGDATSRETRVFATEELAREYVDTLPTPEEIADPGMSLSWSLLGHHVCTEVCR